MLQLNSRRRSKRARSGPAKSPAYQWYPKDALSDGDMAVLSNEQEGLLRRLLDRSWLEDGLPDHQDQLFAWSKCTDRAHFAQLWMTIAPFFPQDPRGRLRNARQERERAKQRKNSRLKKLAAEKRWADERARAHAPADAPASTPAMQVECLPIALALAPPDLDQEQKISGRADERRARPVRMRLTVWEVRPQLLAAVHALVQSGAPFLDAQGEPALSEIHEQMKIHASRHLHATWEGRELASIVDAALGRRAAVVEAELARRRFQRREWADLRKARGGRR